MVFQFLKLIRFQNLLIIIITQVLIKYALFETFGISITLSDFGFFLLCLSTVSIAAAGNIINDVYDAETDRINKPQKQIIGKTISERSAVTAYIVFTIIGVGIGFYLSNLIGRPGFSAIFIVISALLYLYATYLKNIMLVGNIIVSSLVAMVILIMGLFELLPAITPANQQTQSIIFSILLDYAWFAFLINWIREMVKDQQDVNGDHNTGRNTLPVVLGRSRTNKIIFAIGLIPLLSVIFYISEYLYTNIWAVLYALLFIVGPLLYVLIQILSAKKIAHYLRLSLILKLILVMGLLSLGLYPFILL